VLPLCTLAYATALITTPDPSAVTDAYAVLELLWTRHGYGSCGLVVNQAGGLYEGKRTAEKLQQAAKQFLGQEWPVWGVIEADRQFAAAVKNQQLATVVYPNAKALEQIGEMLPRLLGAMQKSDKAA
jgi:flagellar biosynthesis protein FlhG